MVRELALDRHAVYLLYLLKKGFPESHEGVDPNRLTLAHFCIAGLGVLGKLAAVQKEPIVQWVHQLLADGGADCGFRGGPYLAYGRPPAAASKAGGGWSLRITPAGGGGGGGWAVKVAERDDSEDFGHIAMTYSALVVLTSLGADLSALPKAALLRGVRRLQLTDGSYASHRGGENDMRFVYCAAVICHLLGDWAGMDIPLAATYIHRSQSYDGGYGLGPRLEAHGGSTFCAYAALKMMGEQPPPGMNDRLLQWCLQRQQPDGLQGRVNKPPDSCYTFWVGAAAALADPAAKFSTGTAADAAATLDFVLACQKPTGGFGKYSDEDISADPLHTFFSLAGLGLLYARLAPAGPAREAFHAAEPALAAQLAGLAAVDPRIGFFAKDGR